MVDQKISDLFPDINYFMENKIRRLKRIVVFTFDQENEVFLLRNFKV